MNSEHMKRIFPSQAKRETSKIYSIQYTCNQLLGNFLRLSLDPLTNVLGGVCSVEWVEAISLLLASFLHLLHFHPSLSLHIYSLHCTCCY